MTLTHFNHEIYYSNNVFQSIELQMVFDEAKTKTLRGVFTLQYKTQDNTVFNTPALVFSALQEEVKNRTPITFSVDEPRMFVLEVTIKAGTETFVFECREIKE